MVTTSPIPVSGDEDLAVACVIPDIGNERRSYLYVPMKTSKYYPIW